MSLYCVHINVALSTVLSSVLYNSCFVLFLFRYKVRRIRTNGRITRYTRLSLYPLAKTGSLICEHAHEQVHSDNVQTPENINDCPQQSIHVMVKSL